MRCGREGTLEVPTNPAEHVKRAVLKIRCTDSAQAEHTHSQSPEIEIHCDAIANADQRLLPTKPACAAQSRSGHNIGEAARFTQQRAAECADAGILVHVTQTLLPRLREGGQRRYDTVSHLPTGVIIDQEARRHRVEMPRDTTEHLTERTQPFPSLVDHGQQLVIIVERSHIEAIENRFLIVTPKGDDVILQPCDHLRGRNRRPAQQEWIMNDTGSTTDGHNEYLEKVIKAGMMPDEDPGRYVADAGERFDPALLFEPLKVGALDLPNRIVMAPMTRNMSPGGVPGADVAAYYRRRAEGGIGLIVTEGVYIPQPGAGFSAAVPRFYGEDALAGWKRVVDEVHSAGAKIFPQLWHVGLMPLPGDTLDEARMVSPSALTGTGVTMGAPATIEMIEATIRAFGNAAASAQAIGCDGIQIHGAHGYLVDQFFWETTNGRDDKYGGADLLARSNFALEVVRECRARTSPDFPISFRFSQWKQQDFSARLALTPAKLEAFLLPLVEAGVDIFDCSTRRFWEPEFEGSDMNLAGWTKKITGKTTSTVGSISLNTDLFSSFATESRISNNMGRLIEMMTRGDFDLVSVGRSALADANWANKLRDGSLHALNPYSVAALATLD